MNEIEPLECPWPESIFPMDDDGYNKALPDPGIRTAVSGFLMREAWTLHAEKIEEIRKRSGLKWWHCPECGAPMLVGRKHGLCRECGDWDGLD